MRKNLAPITSRRLAKGLSIYRLAKTAGTSPTNLANIEAGQEPGVRLALRIADALEADVRALFPPVEKKGRPS